jgi:hypothetical protein
MTSFRLDTGLVKVGALQKPAAFAEGGGGIREVDRARCP